MSSRERHRFHKHHQHQRCHYEYHEQQLCRPGWGRKYTAVLHFRWQGGLFRGYTEERLCFWVWGLRIYQWRGGQLHKQLLYGLLSINDWRRDLRPIIIHRGGRLKFLCELLRK